MKDLQIALNNYIQDQESWEANLRLAEMYIRYKQYSAGFTHYMKCAELVPESNYQVRYHCLMMISWIYKVEGCRWLGAIQYSRFAKSECPDRPEAYCQLCEIWIDKLKNDGIQEQGEWIQVYENSRIGLMYALMKDQQKSLYYSGIEYLKCYYALSLLKLGKLIDLKKYLNDTSFDESNSSIMDTIIYIYNELREWCPYTSYSSNKYDSLKFQFNGAEEISKNYSQSMQDMFVLTALNGIKDGTYLEIGSADYEYGSNTLLLEKLGWKGVSMDIMINFVYQFTKHRSNKCFCLDALQLNYSEFLKDQFKDTKVIDYLSIDIDPADNTFNALLKIPMDKYEFKVITFEHDCYQSGDSIKLQQRSYLGSLGYELIGSNIKFNYSNSFEDWWINPKYIDKDIINTLRCMFENCNGIVSQAFFK